MYKRQILYTSRNVRTFKGNIGLINKYTSVVLLEWLKNNNVPYDEIYFNKPWGFGDLNYIDDKFLSIDASCLILTYPLNSLSNCVSSTVILSLIIISSNTGRKFAVSPTIDSVGVSSDASSPVTADILVLPMNKSPLLLSPE